MEIFQTFRFESAHRLPKVPPGHKCHNVHGHSYRVDVHVDGEVESETGWIIDFAEIEKSWAPINRTIDHKFLNDIPGLENPTSEVIAQWIWDQLVPDIPNLSKIIVWETQDCGAILTAPTT